MDDDNFRVVAIQTLPRLLKRSGARGELSSLILSRRLKPLASTAEQKSLNKVWSRMFHLKLFTFFSKFHENHDNSND